MLQLHNTRLTVEIDPARGGVIRSIWSKRCNTELLYEAHWRAAKLAEAGRDEGAWTHAWGGGWNVLFPNAGAGCRANGRDCSFHGAASIAPWSGIGSGSSATLRFADDDGLWIERSVELDAARVIVRNTVGNAGVRSAPYVVVEHLIFVAPSSRAVPLSGSQEAR